MKMKMKMKMRMKMLFVLVLMLLTFTQSGLTSAATETPALQQSWPYTTTDTPGSPGINLKGKMFTLSYGRSGVTFFPPYHVQNPSRWMTTSTYSPSTTYTSSWTTSAPTTGLTLCLRYFTDYISTSSFTVFTISPSSASPLTLQDNNMGMYYLSFNRNSMSFKTTRQIWGGLPQNIWTQFCFSVDTKRNVAQVYQDSSTSVRKRLQTPFVWSGVPVLDFSGFDGQLTDVQMWDYPLGYGDIYRYMANYELSRGNVLTWSYIGYSVKGNALLEDDFYTWGKQQVSGRRRGRRPNAEKKKWELLNGVEGRNRKTPQI